MKRVCTACGADKKVVSGDGPRTGPYTLCNPCFGALLARKAAGHYEEKGAAE